MRLIRHGVSGKPNESFEISSFEKEHGCLSINITDEQFQNAIIILERLEVDKMKEVLC